MAILQNDGLGTTAVQSATSPAEHEDTSHFEKVAYLFGYPISHSLSPLVQKTIYSALGKNWTYVLHESQDISRYMTLIKSESKLLGSAVTMPFKVSIIPYLDELTPEGEAIGAVNTIFVRLEAGKKVFCGTNTDCVGIREAFKQNVLDIEALSHNQPALVVGGGGTCRAAVYALQEYMHCSSIYVINRDKSEVDAVITECHERGLGQNIKHITSVEEASELTAPQVIVSAIPDFEPSSETEKVVREILGYFLDRSSKGALLEMCYHPSPDTRIARLAAACGWQVISGTEAMVWQGIEQIKLWSGIEIGKLPIKEAKDALATALQRRSKL